MPLTDYLTRRRLLNVFDRVETLEDLVGEGGGGGGGTIANVTDTANFVENASEIVFDPDYFEVTPDGPSAGVTLIGAPGAGTGGHQIYDEATVRPARAKMAFVGDGVAVTDDEAEDRTVVTVDAVAGPQGDPGDPGADGADGAPGADGDPGLPTEIADEGTPLTARSTLDFEGAGVTVTDDSGGDRTVVTIPGGGGGGSSYPGQGELVLDEDFTGDISDWEAGQDNFGNGDWGLEGSPTGLKPKAPGGGLAVNLAIPDLANLCVTAKCKAAGAAAGLFAICARVKDKDNLVYCHTTRTDSQVGLFTREGGSFAGKGGSASGGNIVADTSFWLRLILMGEYARYFFYSADPGDPQAAVAAAAHQMFNFAEADYKFGSGALGGVGVRMNATAGGGAGEDHRIERLQVHAL